MLCLSMPSFIAVAQLLLIPLSRWSPGRSPGWFTGWSPGWHSFHTGERAPGWIFLVGSCAAEVRMYVFMAHAFKARARQSWAEKSENIQSGFGACIFILRALYCDVTMIDQISPGSLTAMPFTLQLHPGAPGCSREFTRDDSRVTFPKSLAAFYPAFHPRDLSRCDITRVHPGEICSAWKGYKSAYELFNPPSYLPGSASGQKLKFLFFGGGLVFTSYLLNPQHWTGFYNFQGLFFYFRGLFFAFRGRNRPEPPCNFFPWSASYLPQEIRQVLMWHLVRLHTSFNR